MYVSIGALVLLILILIMIGVSLTQLQSLDSFPPTQNACPDYWDVSSNPIYCGVPVNDTMKNFGYINANSNTGVDLTSDQNIGMCTSGSTFGCGGGDKSYLDVQPYVAGSQKRFQYVKLNSNPNWSTLYPGVTERCAQKSWAQTMNISWDGVTNYNGC